MSGGGRKDRFPKPAGKLRRNGIAYLSRPVFPIAIENEGIGESLNACALANGEASMLYGMRETTPREAVEPRRQSYRGLVPCKTSIYVLVAMGRIVDVASKLENVRKRIRAPTLRNKLNALYFDRRQPRLPIVVWDMRMTGAIFGRTRKVSDCIAYGARIPVSSLGKLEPRSETWGVLADQKGPFPDLRHAEVHRVQRRHMDEVAQFRRSQ